MSRGDQGALAVVDRVLVVVLGGAEATEVVEVGDFAGVIGGGAGGFEGFGMEGSCAIVITNRGLRIAEEG
ncbi:MAG: hypothetical protein HC795_00455 [Coleofasciculaceae cyanobacterium RL_1_1]|nr:hypothetical protein [Coleofasciculaceae cyanobacterium RL_1_1]